MLNGNNNGRSMVEMLGVLAIIGVLSIGGIAGYSKAMEKLKWNKFVISIRQLAVTALELLPQIKNDEDITVALSAVTLPENIKIDSHTYSYTPSVGYGYGYIQAYQGFIGISFFYMTDEFCKKLLTQHWQGLFWNGPFGGISIARNQKAVYLDKMPSFEDIDTYCLTDASFSGQIHFFFNE